MKRLRYNRSVMDVSVGIICGVIMHFSMSTYLVIFGIALVAMLVATARGGNPSTYGHDDEGNFHGVIVVKRVIIVNIGAAFGMLVASVFSTPAV